MENNKKEWTVADVRSMTSPAEGFLCEPGANIVGIQFLKHTIESGDSGEVFFTFE